MLMSRPKISTPDGILGKLPKEIRLIIFSYLFNDRYAFSVPRADKHKSHMANINILMTSRVILADAQQVFYGRSLFVMRLQSPNSYCYIYKGVANSALIKRVEVNIEIGFVELLREMKEESKYSRRRSGKALASAHDRDLYWIIPEWFRTMSPSLCFVSFEKPLRWTRTSIWPLAYVYIVLGLCNMGINCDTVALRVNFQDPDWCRTGFKSVGVAKHFIDSL